VFGYPPSDNASVYRSLLETFAFGVLPYIIVMSCISAILMALGHPSIYSKYNFKSLSKLFNIGGPVGLGAAANVFIGQVEAPLLIKPYINKLIK
jgi:CNT family concentrative nucleoside transporter